MGKRVPLTASLGRRDESSVCLEASRTTSTHDSLHSLCVAPDGSLHCPAMAVSTHTFQAPKGTRDFYPHDLAVRRYIESVWREVSINHGFDEIDGPTFEHLDLYTIKSGPGIESELFSFRRSGGDTDYALRPEFTPTLARMYAAKAESLPKPTKWFSIGPFFRAERPQRGRLREHVQLNVDIIGGEEKEQADIEILAVTVAILERLGLSSKQVRIKVSHRVTLSNVLLKFGVAEEKIPDAFRVLDQRHKLRPDDYVAKLAAIGINREIQERIDRFTNQPIDTDDLTDLAHEAGLDLDALYDLLRIHEQAEIFGIQNWISFDFSIVRGLAYYTGLVFEVYETKGKERAIAGGGRYDGLVELFNGPPTPAVGVAMGDVVVKLVLDELGILKSSEEYLVYPDVVVIQSIAADISMLNEVVFELRQARLHVRHSYKATRNVGKLLSEANKARARFAVILGKELDEGNVVLKDLRSGEQEEIARETLIEVLRTKLAACEGG